MTIVVERKARTLLAGCRVHITWATDTITAATVRGDTGSWSIRWDRKEGWRCSCPHPGSRCSHVMAVRLVTTRPVACSAELEDGAVT